MSGPEYPIKEWMPRLFYGDSLAMLNQRIVMQAIVHSTQFITETELKHMLGMDDGHSEIVINRQLQGLTWSDILFRCTQNNHTFYAVTPSVKQFLRDHSYTVNQQLLEPIPFDSSVPEIVSQARSIERPSTKFATVLQDGRDFSDTPQWKSAYETTYRELQLSRTILDDNTVRATVVEQDNQRQLATVEFDVVDEPLCVSEVETETTIVEPRGKIVVVDDYDIRVRESCGDYSITVERQGRVVCRSPVDDALEVFTSDGDKTVSDVPF